MSSGKENESQHIIRFTVQTHFVLISFLSQESNMKHFTFFAFPKVPLSQNKKKKRSQIFTFDEGSGADFGRSNKIGGGSCTPS